jgi:hypothetical protein
MRKHLGFAIVLSLIILHPAFLVSEGLDATCEVDCGDVTVSCTTNSPGNCQAVDRNCAVGERGSVTCNGTTFQCPVCPTDPPPPDCSQYDNPATGCYYTWDYDRQCCVAPMVGGSFCPDTCGW